ncbi:heavy-metal-associated domain-containing protein, partial [Enterobacter cloacae]
MNQLKEAHMVRFNVPDMTCGGCAQRIRRAIAQAPMPAGVEVEIDV